jgi:protein ImuB
LRIAIDPPEAAIISLRVTAHFAHPRTAQRGLFSATKPEPESLLLTVNKIKKLVGEENVGVPILLNRRVERAFTLAHEALPVGCEIPAWTIPNPIIAFSYFHPPLAAEIITQNKRLIFLRTKNFSGRVNEYGGVWKESSEWWTRESWFSEMWDVELENRGVYRLMRKGELWFVVGEYD